VKNRQPDAPQSDSSHISRVPDESGAQSRRDFLLRAGAVGLAATAAGPLFATNAYAQSATDELAGTPFGARAAEPFTRSLATVDLGLRWRLLGPFRGGRVDAVTGVPGRPNEFYFGSVNGGVWKTIDGGRVWTPVFDSQPVASIGSIAVAPSSPNTVYVGTGESTLRDSAGFGNGVYKSTDAGKTWTHLGLDNTHHIGKVTVDPKDPNVVFVAAIGFLYAPNPDRGVFRSRDGGKTWQKVLFKGNDVGAVDVSIDPTDSRIVYACLWNTRRPPWYTYQPSNGPGGGLWKSTDGGSSWKQMTHGLPADGIGRAAIAVAPSEPRRLYAVIDDLLPEPGAAAAAPPAAQPAAPPGAAAGAAGRGAPQVPRQGGFFRSDDAGATWKRVSSDNALWGRGWYFEKLAVDPRNADIVYVPNVAVSRTKDGGTTWVALRGSPGGDDYHQAWISPDDSNTMIVASDQGAIITRNATTDDARAVTWSSWLNQPTAQIYHMSVDYRSPYWVTGAQQDSGSVAVRSRGKFGEISMRDWEPIGAGGESGCTAGDPLHPGIIYGGMGSRFDLEANADVPGSTQPRASEPLRSDWTQPLVLSKADPRNLYYAAQFLFKSSDTAATWKQISPDLTRPSPGVPATLDAAAAADTDRNGQRGVIYSVCPSPLLVPMVWVGTDDGLVHVTVNDGRSWSDVTPKELTAWSRVTGVEASHFDFNSAYLSVSRHQLQDYEPYIYRTRDQGKTWQRITKGLPGGVYVHAVKEDPERQGLLVAGTERGAFISFDDGDNWQSLQLNLPATSVRDFEFYNGDLIVATHGRGFWVIDDIAPLRQISDAVLAADAYLFKPTDHTNYAQGGDNGTPLQKDEPQALNPANGVVIDYYLKTAPASAVTLEIVDSTGAVVGSFSSAPSIGAPAAGGRGGGGVSGGIPSTSPLWRPEPERFSASAGMHRVVWSTSRGGRGFGGGGGRGTALPPFTGTFTAKLTVDGKVMTQAFTVRPEIKR
jgi:photosystem II stability/assembly factor-like uncharacterized protein